MPDETQLDAPTPNIQETHESLIKELIEKVKELENKIASLVEGKSDTPVEAADKTAE